MEPPWHQQSWLKLVQTHNIQARSNRSEHHPSKKQLLIPSKQRSATSIPSKQEATAPTPPKQEATAPTPSEQHHPSKNHLLRGWQWEIPVCKNAHSAHWFVLSTIILPLKSSSVWNKVSKRSRSVSFLTVHPILYPLQTATPSSKSAGCSRKSHWIREA